MAQNIYDNPAFFEGYAQLPRSVQGLDGAPEWPSLKSMLPDLTGKSVIDLGCGYGWFCRAARELGASDITGVDISEKMLARAAELTADPQIHYQRSDLESLALKDNSLDLVYSSLALHYLPELDTLFANVQRALKPGGSLVFSMEHPIYTCAHPPGLADRRQRRAVLGRESLSGREPARQQLAGGRGHQVSPYAGHHAQRADQGRINDKRSQRMGANAGANCGLARAGRRGRAPDAGADRRP